jgi:thioredoxin reductase
MYDVVVIGAGPAGLAAAAYTARGRLSTLIIAPEFTGKAGWRLGLPWLHGREVILGEETVEQLRQIIISDPRIARRLETVETVFRRERVFHIMTAEGGAYHARAVVVATGVSPRPLGVPGEQRLLGYGVTYSAVSHAHVFEGRRVAVVGADLRALRAVQELRRVAAHVTLVPVGQADLGSFRLARHLMQDDRVTVLAGHVAVEILGDDRVSGLVVADQDGNRRTIPLEGVFIENGLVAHTEFLGTLVARTLLGQIVVDARGATSCPGVYAAGDITETTHAEQILIALGEGAKAGLSVCADMDAPAADQPQGVPV